MPYLEVLARSSLLPAEGRQAEQEQNASKEGGRHFLSIEATVKVEKTFLSRTQVCLLSQPDFCQAWKQTNLPVVT